MIEKQVNTGFNISNLYWVYCLPKVSCLRLRLEPISPGTAKMNIYIYTENTETIGLFLYSVISVNKSSKMYCFQVKERSHVMLNLTNIDIAWHHRAT